MTRLSPPNHTAAEAGPKTGSEPLDGSAETGRDFPAQVPSRSAYIKYLLITVKMLRRTVGQLRLHLPTSPSRLGPCVQDNSHDRCTRLGCRLSRLPLCLSPSPRFTVPETSAAVLSPARWALSATKRSKPDQSILASGETVEQSSLDDKKLDGDSTR